jgi:RNA-directed DNA polymerase
MSFFQEIQQENIWLDFLDNEGSKVMPDTRLIKQVQKIIDNKSYTKFGTAYFRDFPIPRYHEIKQFNTKKTRNVFIYPKEQNIVLKVLAFYLLNQYNDKFASNSLAYTRGRGVKSAFKKLESFHLKLDDQVFKNDFSDYFNLIDLSILKTKLDAFFEDKDRDVQNFIMQILGNPNTTYKGRLRVFEQKGVMAGTPISGILANIYMHELDLEMQAKHFKYLRYADDTLIVGKEALDYFIKRLADLNIKLNPKKEQIFTMRTGITFLGFYYKGRAIDISPEAKAKMKSRMKRRAKWYRKWMLDRNVNKTVALKHYIKGINEKLYSYWDDSVNWSLWYLPNINVTGSIKFLDEYFVNCIRYLNSGTWKRGKKYYSLSYQEIKKLGFRSLINTYYRIQKCIRNGTSFEDAIK